MRVTFRAQFAGLTGRLNPSGWKIAQPAPMTVEIFRRGDSWHAREVDSKKRVELVQIGSGPAHGVIKDLVRECFDKQLSPWAMFDLNGVPVDPARVEEDPKGNFTLRDLTHISIMGAGSQGKTGPNYFNTICGIEVHVHLLRSVRHATGPDCPTCREAWSKTPEGERLKA